MTILRTVATGAAVVVACLLGSAPAAGAPAAHTVRPGDTITTVEPDSSIETCTVGLVGKIRSTGRPLGITAGHCFEPDSVIYNKAGDRIGAVISQVAEGTDIADLSGYTAIAFDRDVRVSATTTYGTQSVGAADLHPGRPACHIGATSGLACGTIKDFSLPTRVDVDVASDHGDSGGPVIEYVEDSSGSKRFVTIGIAVRGGADHPLSMNPLPNLIKNVNDHFGKDWAYYYTADASSRQ